MKYSLWKKLLVYTLLCALLVPNILIRQAYAGENDYLDVVSTAGENIDGRFNSVVYANGKYTAVGEEGRIIRSVDGLSWVRVTTEATNATTKWKSLIYALGVYVAVGEDSATGRAALMTSPDGESWTNRSTVINASRLEKVKYLNGSFYAVGGRSFTDLRIQDTGVIYKSDTGVNWTVWDTVPRIVPLETPSSTEFTLTDFGLANSYYVVTGNQLGGYSYTLFPGIGWTNVFIGNKPLGAISHYNGKTHIAEKGGIGYSGSTLVSLSADPDYNGMFDLLKVGTTFYRFGKEGRMYSSTDDGVNWNQQLPVTNATNLSMATNGIGMVLITSTDHSLIVSSDRIHWLKLQSSLQSMAFNGYGWVVVGTSKSINEGEKSDGTILTSFNGWDQLRPAVNVLPNVSFSKVAFGNNVFVAMGNKIGVSNYGENWTLFEFPTGVSGHVTGLTFGNGRFVAVTDQNEILASPDGRSWSVDTGPIAGGLTNIKYMNGRYIALGNNAAFISDYYGLNWVKLASLNTYLDEGYSIKDITYADGSYAALAYAEPFGTVILKSSGELSADSIWMMHPVPYGSVELNSIAYGNGYYVISGAKLGSRKEPIIYSSPDLNVWTPYSEYALGLKGGGLHAVSFQDGKFYAVGENSARVVLRKLSNPSLASVLGQTDNAPGGGDGLTPGTAIHWTLFVPNETASLGLEDIVQSDYSHWFQLYSLFDYESGEITGSSTLELIPGGMTTAHIKVSAPDGAMKYYAVSINRAEGAPDIAHLDHNGTVTHYSSIQAAINAAVDGDTVTVDAGRFREQLTITHNITLKGAGMDATVIEAPDSTALVPSNWQNLKSQLVYAVVNARTNSSGEVVIKDLTVDGRKMGYIAAYNGDESIYTYTGIAVRDSSAVIDRVKVMDIRDTYSDYPYSVVPLPGDYFPQDQPSGANHNDSILLEGAAGTGPHRVTVSNSSIERFHKTGILAWGPTLDVNIHDNDIQGHGNTLYSTGNGIQIASTDKTSQGGGDRRGTTGIAQNNHIHNIGLVIPEPGQPGGYLNLGLYGPTGILLNMAGDNFIVEGNTITGPSVYPWHLSTTSSDGGYSNDGIGVSFSRNATIQGNVVTGFSTGILEGGTLPGSAMNLDNNTLSSNLINIWTLSGDDVIDLGPNAGTIAYNQTGNGVDTIYGFGDGDRILVVGFVEGSIDGVIGSPQLAQYVTDTNGNQVINRYLDGRFVVDFTNGTVTTGDGTLVDAHSVEIAVTDNVTTLYIDTEGDADAPELVIKLAGTYAPGNFELYGSSIRYVSSSVIDVDSLSFDKNVFDTSIGHYRDAVVNLTLNNHQLMDVLLNGTSIGSGNYLVTGSSQVTLRKEYLATLDTGPHVFTLDMSGGADPTLTVTVSDTSPAQEEMPVAAIDFVNEKLTGLVPNAQYKINDTGLVTANDSGIADILDSWLGTTLSIVKAGNGTTKTDSAPQLLPIPGRPAAPANIGKTDETYPGAYNGTITNVNDTMEYKDSSGDVWSNAGNGISFLTSGTYYVRYKATAAQFVSYGAVVTIGSMSPEETPVAAIDFANEKLTGLVPDAQYKINDTGLVTANDAGTAAILDSWLGTTLSIVKAGNGTTKTDSAPQLLPIPGRPAAPADIGKTDETYNGAHNGTITNVNGTMEYKKGPAGAWTDTGGTSVTGLAPDTYYVRYKATSAQFVSDPATLTILASGKTQEYMPSAIISFVDEHLIGLLPNSAYKINGTTVTADTYGHIAVSGSWIGETLSVVKTGNDTTTIDSAAQSLMLPGRPAVPANVGKTDESFPAAHDGTITNVTTSMEYKRGLDGTWMAIGSTTITGLAPDIYYVRIKATFEAFASEATSVTVGSTDAVPAITPAAGISYTDEKITGLEPNAAYKINQTSVITDGSGQISIGSNWIGATLSLVKTGNGQDTTDSEAQLLTIPGRPMAPAGIGQTDESFPGAHDGTITNTTAAMEYKKGIAGEWTAAGGTTVTGLDPDTYYIRTKATATALASEETQVTVSSTTPNPQVPAGGLTVTAADPSGAANDGKTQITVAPAAAAPGHKLVYIIFGSGGVIIPNEGDMAAGYHDLPANGLISAVNGSKIGIAVIDAEGKIVSFGWTTSIVAAEPAPDSGSDDPVDSGSAAPNTGNPSTPAADDVIVLVNGKVENAGKARITEAEGVKTTAIIVDPAKLQAKLDAEGQGAIVTIPVRQASNVIVGELNGQMVKNMENTSSTLVLQTEKASYTLPAGEINIDAVSASLGGSVKLQDIIVRITIAETDSRMAQIVATAAAEGEFKVMLPSVDFTVTGEYNGKTVEITTFNTYVERSVALPDNIDPSKITTGVVVEADGTVRHVPTKVEIKDGKYYALINSLTNSTYSVVWHPLAFADVDNHWAKAAVNDMGSRMVVNGVSNTSFNPDQAITRAEFAAIIVRGLGLRLGEGKNPFSDVAAQEWYTGAVQTAASYGLIAGYEDGTFRPNATITREEAFTMTARAMKITGLEKKTGLADPSSLLAEFTDGTGISDWAKTSIALTAKAGLVSGRNGGRLEAQASVTRAEVATLIQRLLMKSKLI